MQKLNSITKLKDKSSNSKKMYRLTLKNNVMMEITTFNPQVLIKFIVAYG